MADLVVDQASIDTQEIQLTSQYILLATAGSTLLLTTPFCDAIFLTFQDSDVTGQDVFSLPHFPFLAQSQIYWGAPLKNDLYIAAGSQHSIDDDILITVTL